MESTFLTTETDKFKNKTTTECVNPYVIKNEYDDLMTASFMHTSTPEVDALGINILYASTDWMFLRDGELIININNVENVVLKPKEAYTDTIRGNFEAYSKVAKVELTGSDSVHCWEGAWYGLSQDILKKICDAQSIDMKIGGGKTSETVSANSFITYSRLFYNAFYDNEAYKDTVEKNSKQISPKNSGCMLALGIIGSVAAACVYSLCVLFSNIF